MGGHSGENSISGKTGIHFKISAQKGSRAVLKPDRAPGSLQFSPLALQSTRRTQAGVCWERHHIYYEAGAGGEMPPPTCEHRVGCGE